MKNTIQVFENNEFGKVRVVHIDGQPWWILKDVCEILGLTNPTVIANRLDEDERAIFKTKSDLVLDLPNRGLTIINESGLYAVILRSDKPNAKQFRKWVTSEILPSIRKHGAYINEEVLRRMREDRAYSEELLNILTVERIRNAALYNKVAQLVPKAIYHDIILQCPDAVQVSIIAKDYGMSAVAFNKLLYRLKVQFRMGNTWLLYQKYADKGYSISKTFLINGRQASMHTYFTQRGRFWLYELLKSHGILPEAEKRANRQMTFDDAGTSA